MCGICGFIGQKDNRLAILSDMMNAIRHRGPDSNGIFQRDEVSLGFCRLSIIDLKKGDQPMFNERGTMCLIFNGEIYNYRELRENLEQKGNVFSTDSDSETLLHGYEEYGEGLLKKLRGMFAFAIWDFRRKRLFAARDFFGIKPFYYAEIDGCFVFASEIKSILCYPGYKKKVNEKALEQYLAFQYSVLRETFFEGIFKLEPGCFLVYENGKLKTQRYFTPILIPQDMDENVEMKLEKVLEESLKRHLVSDVEVGAFLSGGIDSNYLAAGMKKGKTFTVGFGGEDNRYSEIRHVGELKEIYPLENYAKVITKEDYWNAIPKVAYYLDEPSGDASAIALYFVAKEAAKQVKVVLSGEGADEFLGGYNIYREPGDLKWMDWIPAKLRRKIACVAEHLPDIKGRDYLIRAGIPVEERYIGNAHIFSFQEIKQLLKNNTDIVSTEQFLKKQYEDISKLETMSKMQQIDINNWLPGDILQKADRMSMANSLEVRVPYLDYDVFDLARKLPEKAKINHHQTKYLFRKVAAKRLPAQIVNRKKLGFPVPIRVWIREEPWKSEIEEAFTSETANQFFHVNKLLELLDKHMKGKQDNSRKIWTIYMFLVWYQVYFSY